jgi:ribonucleoside-triphosphate reductase
MNKSTQILSDITVFMKYAKYIPELQRRETWTELVDRNKTMHIKKFPQLAEEIEEAYKYVYDRKILPSMRSMQFAGKPIEINPARIYNCAYLPIDDWRAFGEVMFLLLGGTGVGFSVQKHHVEKLAEIRLPNTNRKKRFLVNDSIEGWADAVKMLVKSYYTGGPVVNFDFSDIRPKGARLVTSGGKAPGPQPLKECLIKIDGILSSKQNGEKLSSIEVHDIVCHIADAVLAGGIRRAALISLFSADDDDMIACKSGNWWEGNAQRGRANNSAVLLRHKITEQFFFDLWKRIELSGAGEPGIYLTNDKDWGTNPCCEIALRPYQFCNLCEVNVSDITSQEDLNARVKAAAFIGTLQAGYTDFHYLRDVWRRTTEKDALIGVSMTGIGSGTVLGYNMKEAADLVKAENERVAGIIGINKSARTTTVKPAGCQIPSTVIRTDRGDLSLHDIFELNGVNLENHLDDYREWFPVTTEIRVYDENGEENKITKLFVNGFEETVKFTMEDGSVIECTPNHRFMMKDGSWKQAIDITEEDEWAVV